MSDHIKIWLTMTPKSRFWVIRYLDPETGQVRQESTKTTKKKEAERRLGKLQESLINGHLRGRNNTSWQAFREKYEADVLPGLSIKTTRKIDTTLDAVERLLKPRRLSDLTASRISSFVAELRNGSRAESTIAGYLRHLQAALSWAVNVGILTLVPKIQKPTRAKIYMKPKGRAPTEAEFECMRGAVPEIVGEDRAHSWRHLIEGLWWSGLRLGEALELTWDRNEKLCIDLSGKRPLLQIPAELEKGHRDRLLPVAPEFARFLLKTAPEHRTGFVFNPQGERFRESRPTPNRVIKVVSDIGRKAGVVVNVDARTGQKKYASAHDFRRAFGDRWALRVMPPLLMQLMRHASIETTMKYYVGRNVEATAELIWEAFNRATGSDHMDRNVHATAELIWEAFDRSVSQDWKT